VKPIPLFRWLSRARVLDLEGRDVYDGDTLTVALDPAFKDRPDAREVKLVRVRLLDVWAPEVTGAERARGAQAREYARMWLREAHDGREWPLVVETFQAARDDRKTFDRWVADVWRTVDGAHLNADIVRAGFATAVRTELKE